MSPSAKEATLTPSPELSGCGKGLLHPCSWAGLGQVTLLTQDDELPCYWDRIQGERQGLLPPVRKDSGQTAALAVNAVKVAQEPGSRGTIFHVGHLVPCLLCSLVAGPFPPLPPLGYITLPVPSLSVFPL